MSLSWGNWNGIWLVLPLTVGYLLVAANYKFKFNLLDRLFSNHANYFKYQKKLKIKLVLWFLALLALLIAFMAPQWGESEQLAPQAGRNIVIALDVSKSMLAEDFKSNRLNFAKIKIKKLVQKLAGDRIGLILFAGDALVMCPLTRDRELLLTFLDDAGTQTISSGTTNLASAILTATKMVEQSNDGSTNLLVIFTDGEDFAGNTQVAGQAAQDAGIKIFAVGVASLQGAPIPDFDGNGKTIGFIKDKQGSVVISKLNQEVLEQTVSKCGGHSMIAQAEHDDDLNKIINWVANFERHKIADKLLTVKIERYYYFAAWALLMLLIEWLL